MGTKTSQLLETTYACLLLGLVFSVIGVSFIVIGIVYDPTDSNYNNYFQVGIVVACAGGIFIIFTLIGATIYYRKKSSERIPLIEIN